MADIELTVKQVAAELRTSERNVRRWLAEGKLTGRRVGRGNLGECWRVDADSVRRLAADRQTRGRVATDKPHGNPADTLAADQVAALADQVRSLREENAEYRQAIELQAQAISGLTGQVRSMSEVVAQLRRLLPPAPEEEETPRPRWWQVWRRRDG